MRSRPIPGARTTSLVIFLAAIAFQASCNNSSNHHSEPSGTAVVQITDVPFSDLHSLTLTITRVRLFSAVDDAPEDVFPSRTSAATALVVDLVALDGATALLGAAAVPPGEFSAVEITYSSAAAIAGNPASPQSVSPSAGTIRIDFAAPRQVTANQFASILLDFDGEASATGSGPGVTLTPTLFEVGGEAGSQVVELRGAVVDVGDSRFTVDFDDGTPGAAAIGRLPVSLGVTSVMRVDAESFSGPSGLAGIATGDRAEVSGRLGRDGIEADLVHIDRINDLNLKATVRFRGTVTVLSPLAIVVNAVLRDRSGLLQDGQTIDVTLSPSVTILPESGTVALGISSIFVGQEVEVVGKLGGLSLTADLVTLRRSRVAGSLSSIDVHQNTAALAPTELNGGSAAVLASPVTLALSSAEGTLGQTSPFDLSRFSAGQDVLATGTFAQPPNNIGPAVFLVSELSLEELQDFEPLPSSADLAAGTFAATVLGSPVTVALSDSTRLAVRHAGVPDRLFNVGRDDFLGALPLISGTGTVSVRGFLSAGRIEAIRAVMTITVP